VAELEERGLSRQAAEQLLDAGLALGLSVWVGARPYRWGQRWAGLQAAAVNPSGSAGWPQVAVWWMPGCAAALSCRCHHPRL
jgi:hypothetical protein